MTKGDKPIVGKAVKHYGEIGAGRVIPFIPRDETTTVYLPEAGRNPDSIGTVRVRGNSLVNLGIFDGDTLIFSKTFTKKSITPRTVCVLFVQSFGELMAKKVLFNQKGVLTLRSSGDGVKDIYVEPEDVDIWGVVIGMQRMFENGQIPDNTEPEDPF